MWYVYFLKSCRKRWYYVGSTNRLSERLEEHNQGQVFSTKSHIPLRLVFAKEFIYEKDARSYEKKLKNKRIEKEAVIKEIEDSNS